MSLFVDRSHVAGPPPVFVGGTGRSGTSVTGRVLGHHERYAVIPIEIRFHVDRGGIPDLLTGLVSLDGFTRRLIDHWYLRTLPNGETRGMHTVIDEETLNSAVDVFVADFGQDPWSSSARLIDDLLTSYSVSQGKAGWIEMTPDNMYVGSLLVRLFPDMRMIHSVRDPRDVVSSVVPLGWGPNDHTFGLAWWAERMYRAHEQHLVMPEGSVLTSWLEDLVCGDARSVANSLTAFVGVEPSQHMAEYLADKVTADRAHLARWKSDPGFGPAELEKCAILLDELAACGVATVERYREKR